MSSEGKENVLSQVQQISKEQIDYFQENGHVMIKQVCPQEALYNLPSKQNSYISQIERSLFGVHKNQQAKRLDDYSKMFVQGTNLWLSKPGEEQNDIKDLVLSKRFASVAAQLLQCDHVRLYRDQSLFKMPNSDATPWHADIYYWPFEDYRKAVTMWMPLNDITDSMGPMTFASKSHLLMDEKGENAIQYMAINDASHQYYEKVIKERSFELVTYKTMQAGDATFHLSSTLHSALSNVSSNTRKAFTVVYVADETKIMSSIDNENRKVDLKTFIPDRKEGEFVNGQYNPLLY